MQSTRIKPLDQNAYLPAYELSNTLIREVDSVRPSQHTFLHYTSLDAFYSIMTHRKLRLTSVKSTNDPSEFLFGKMIIERALKETLEAAHKDHQKILELALNGLSIRDFRAFVFCMSEAVEDEADVGELSQWRLYGADGRGVALVFDISTPANKDKLVNLVSIPRRVVYGEVDGLMLAKQEITAFLDGIATLPADTRDYLAKNAMGAAGYLANCVFWLPSVIKHKAYRHEREVRLVRGDIGEHVGNPLIFYEKGSIRRPAIELPIAETIGVSPNFYQHSPISKIIIGPSGDQAAIEDSIRFFLDAKGWHTPVVRSDIPYRAV